MRLPIIIIIHTLGLFYFLLGNVSPKYRSALRAINLVAVVKKFIKEYSMNAVLTPIVNDLKKTGKPRLSLIYIHLRACDSAS